MSARSRHFVNMGVVFSSLLCATASAFQYSHLAKDFDVFVTNCMNNPRSCSAGVDETRVFGNCLYSLCRPCFLVSLVPSTRIQHFCLLFGLHANIVEEFVLASALMHDQSRLQSSSCFQHQFVWLPFSRTLVCKGWATVCSFVYMGARDSCLRA